MNEQQLLAALREAVMANLDEAELELAYAKRIGKPRYAEAHLEGMIARLRDALNASSPSVYERFDDAHQTRTGVR